MSPIPKTWATRAEAAAAARRWDTQQLECRTNNHAWAFTSLTSNETLGFFHEVSTCSRCGTVKHKEMSTRGAVFSSWYAHPEGYLSEGIGRIAGDARDALRIELVNRRRGARKTDDIPRSHIARTVLRVNR